MGILNIEEGGEGRMNTSIVRSRSRTEGNGSPIRFYAMRVVSQIAWQGIVLAV